MDTLVNSNRLGGLLNFYHRRVAWVRDLHLAHDAMTDTAATQALAHVSRTRLRLRILCKAVEMTLRM
ncbi:MAG TPA: hypothetical protein VGD80_31650 [Kofleriaceae bacterium]